MSLSSVPYGNLFDVLLLSVKQHISYIFFSKIYCYSYFLQFSPNQILASLPLAASIPQATSNVNNFGSMKKIFMNMSTILDKVNQAKEHFANNANREVNLV